MILSVFEKRDALELIKQDYLNIKLLNKNFLNDKKFMLQAIMVNSACVKYVSHELRCDVNFLKRAIYAIDISLDKRYRLRITDINHTVRNNKGLITLLLKRSFSNAIDELKYLSEDIRNDKSVSKEIEKLYVIRSMQNSKEVRNEIFKYIESKKEKINTNND